MAINFPNSPSNNQSYTSGGKTYTYNSTKTVWTVNQTLGYDSDTVINLISTNANKVFTVANLTALGVLTGMSTGDQVIVTSNNKLFMYNGTGWYLIATIANGSPSAITGADSDYTLATDGTPITINAISTDPEGGTLTWSSSTSGLTNEATITQGTGDSSNYFTVTPSTTTTHGGTFTLTIAVTDNVNGAVNFPIGFTLEFAPDWSSTPASIAAIVPSNLAANDAFGIEVDIDRNYAVIGAQGRSDNVNSGGGAYVYYKSGGTWSQQALLLPPSLSASSLAGNGVAIGGTSEGAVVAIGAYAHYDGTYRGKASWFTRSGTTWSHAASVNGPGSNHTTFGKFIKMSGNTTIVCAQADDTGSTNAGRVYVYTGSGVAQANFAGSDTASADAFGKNADIDGDLIVVGADGHDTGGSNRGAAYVFERSGTTWTQKAKLTSPSDLVDGDNFGVRVACHEGANGTNTIAIGCKTPTSAGKVYIFTGSGTSYTQQAKIVPADIAAGDKFGGSDGGTGVEFDKGQAQGDVLFIAAPFDDDSVSNSGSVYIFSRSGTTWSQTHKLNAFTVGPTATGLFGYGMGVDKFGNLIVGASNDSTSFSGGGAAYIFDAQ